MVSDLINRRDAIRAVANYLWHYPNEQYKNLNVFEIGESLVKDALSIVPSADRQDDNRLHIKIYADDEPSRKAEKLYQICGETESQEVAQWLKEYFPSADRPTGEWIPVSERLPKEEENTYWICTDTGYQCECRWTNVNHFWTDMTTDWHWHFGDFPQYTKVIAWMELPEPYKGGDDSE